MTIRRKLDTYIGVAVAVAALLVALSVRNAVRHGLTIAVVPVLVLACCVGHRRASPDPDLAR